MTESYEYALRDDSYVMVRRLSTYCADDDGRFRYGYAILDERHALLAVGTDLRTGRGRDDGPRAMLATLCSFLQAFAEANTHPASDNSSLFSPDLADWAAAHSDELARIEMELRAL